MIRVRGAGGAPRGIPEHSRTRALLAEDRLGELLAETERAKGAQGQFKGRDSSGSTVCALPEETEPTLEELGIKRKESMQGGSGESPL